MRALAPAWGNGSKPPHFTSESSKGLFEFLCENRFPRVHFEVLQAFSTMRSPLNLAGLAHFAAFCHFSFTIS
jgi:hypothetical protein